MDTVGAKAHEPRIDIEVVDAVILSKQEHPEYSNREVSEDTGVDVSQVSRALASDYARVRLLRAPNVSKAQALAKIVDDTVENAAKFIQKLVARGQAELEKDRPNSSILNNARAVAVEALKGTGVFREHSVTAISAIDPDELTLIMDRADKARAELLRGLGMQPAEVTIIETVKVATSEPKKIEIEPETSVQPDRPTPRPRSSKRMDKATLALRKHQIEASVPRETPRRGGGGAGLRGGGGRKNSPPTQPPSAPNLVKDG